MHTMGTRTALPLAVGGSPHFGPSLSTAERPSQFFLCCDVRYEAAAAPGRRKNRARRGGGLQQRAPPTRRRCAPQVLRVPAQQPACGCEGHAELQALLRGPPLRLQARRSPPPAAAATHMRAPQPAAATCARHIPPPPHARAVACRRRRRRNHLRAPPSLLLRRGAKKSLGIGAERALFIRQRAHPPSL